ncbi:MAG: FAD-binding protein [Stellaceae bacterium]
MPEDQTVEEIAADLVVGGGRSGCRRGRGATRPASCRAGKAGRLGGNTALSVGSIMTAGSRQQRRAGIVDTPAAHARDLDHIRHAMTAEDDPALRQLLTENVADTLEFLHLMGINFLGPMPQPPHTASRLHQVMPTSGAYIARLGRYCRKHGGEIRLNTRAAGLVTDAGRVVEAVTDGGRWLRAMARAAVVMSSGDIGGDNAIMHRYMKSWVDGIAVYNPLNVGEGHRIAAAIGPHIVPRKDLPAAIAAHVRPKPSLLQRIPPDPWLTAVIVRAMAILPSRLVRPFMMRFLTTTLGPNRGVYEEGAILVNKLGDRFADEIAGANLKIPNQPDGIAYIIFDERFARKFSRWPHFISTAPDIAFAFIDDYRTARPDPFHRADSLNDLARRLRSSPDRLAAAVAAANAARPEDNRLVEGPFYALGPVKLWVLVAPVGLAVNTRLEALTETGVPIPGLYSAGNAGQAGFMIYRVTVTGSAGHSHRDSSRAGARRRGSPPTAPPRPRRVGRRRGRFRAATRNGTSGRA